MKISLGYQVIFAIALGVVAGLFFGPYCSVLDPVGKIFFMLLQMVVLPYLLFLLIHGLGSISPDIAKKLFRRGWVFFIVIWATGFAIVYSLLTLIPTPQLIFVEPVASGSDILATSLLNYLIPRNVFYDLANNIIPAITICGLIGGLALMSIEKKDAVLTVLSQVNTSIEKILHWLAVVSPIVIFSHVAVVAGTIKLENLAKVDICIAVFYYFDTLSHVLVSSRVDHFSDRPSVQRGDERVLGCVSGSLCNCDAEPCVPVSLPSDQKVCSEE
jgi:proton glutamate symport protein